MDAVREAAQVSELHEQLQPDEPLLGAVVRVTFELPPFGIGVLDDPPA